MGQHLRRCARFNFLLYDKVQHVRLCIYSKLVQQPDVYMAILHPSPFLTLLMVCGVCIICIDVLVRFDVVHGRADHAVRRPFLILVVRDDGPCLVAARVQAVQDHAALPEGLPHAQGELNTTTRATSVFQTLSGRENATRSIHT